MQTQAYPHQEMVETKTELKFSNGLTSVTRTEIHLHMNANASEAL